MHFIDKNVYSIQPQCYFVLYIPYLVFSPKILIKYVSKIFFLLHKFRKRVWIQILTAVDVMHTDFQDARCSLANIKVPFLLWRSTQAFLRNVPTYRTAERKFYFRKRVCKELMKILEHELRIWMKSSRCVSIYSLYYYLLSSTQLQ